MRIVGERHADDRGYFERVFCARDWAAAGMPRILQTNISYNRSRGTLRGLHYQMAPFAEDKVVTCVRGALYDVLVDLRSKEPRWVAVELTDTDPVSLFIPKGFAHGFQTLVDDTVVLYQMSAEYVVSSARGIRYDDPKLAIDWPLAAAIVSARDREFPEWPGQ